jgi:hypothetical protein
MARFGKGVRQCVRTVRTCGHLRTLDTLGQEGGSSVRSQDSSRQSLPLAFGQPARGDAGCTVARRDQESPKARATANSGMAATPPR